MSEEARLQAAVERTQQLLSDLVHKTPLSAKLLSKPPFRFLHDLTMEILQNSGFATGLYDETESQSSQVNDKDAKIRFLQKLMDCLTLSTGVELKAKPAKIVAGLEPEETNTLLQELANAALQKADARQAVFKLTGKMQPAAETSASETAAPPKTAPPPKPATTANTNTANANNKSNSASRERLATKGKSSSKSDLGGSRGSLGSLSNKTSKPAASTPAKKSASTPKSTTNFTTSSTPTSAASQDAKSSESIDEEAPPGVVHAVQDISPAAPPTNPSTLAAISFTVPPANMPLSPSPAPVIATMQAPAPIPQPSMSNQRPTTAARRPSAVVRKVKSTDPTEPSEPTQKPQVILDNDGIGKDGVNDVEAYVVLQSATAAMQSESQAALMDAMGSLPVAEGAPSSTGEQHGGLVRKILETNNKFLASEDGPITPLDPVAQHSRTKERALYKQQMDSTRDMVQSICRNAAPLAKWVDYFEEDLASMNKEMNFWKSEAKKYKLKMLEEARETEKCLAPLEQELERIEQLIAAQMEKNEEVQAQCAHREQTIKRLMQNVVGNITVL